MTWNENDEFPKEQPKTRFSVTPDKLEEISSDFLLAADSIIINSQAQAELDAPSRGYSPAIILLAFALKAQMKALVLFAQDQEYVDGSIASVDLDQCSLSDFWILTEPILREMHPDNQTGSLDRAAAVIENLQTRIESIESVEYSIHHGSESMTSSAKDGFISLIEIQGAVKGVHSFICVSLSILRDSME